jgi:hypothetical protein
MKSTTEFPQKIHLTQKLYKKTVQMHTDTPSAPSYEDTHSAPLCEDVCLGTHQALKTCHQVQIHSQLLIYLDTQMHTHYDIVIITVHSEPWAMQTQQLAAKPLTHANRWRYMLSSRYVQRRSMRSMRGGIWINTYLGPTHADTVPLRDPHAQRHAIHTVSSMSSQKWRRMRVHSEL